jgi:hypothetical protein
MSPDSSSRPVAFRRYQETITDGELFEGITAFQEKRSPQFPWRG